MSDSLQPHGLQPTRLLCPWDFPGKSTGVGCHCLKMLRVNKVVVSDNDKCSVGESNGLNNDDDDVHS